MSTTARYDVHQHLLPEPVLTGLAARRSAPCVRRGDDGWVLSTADSLLVGLLKQQISGVGGHLQRPLLQVRATDAAGNTGSAGTRVYALDRVAPVAPTITGNPGADTNDNTVRNLDSYGHYDAANHGENADGERMELIKAGITGLRKAAAAVRPPLNIES